MRICKVVEQEGTFIDLMGSEVVHVRWRGHKLVLWIIMDFVPLLLHVLSSHQCHCALYLLAVA